MLASKLMKKEYIKYISPPDKDIATDTVHSITLSYPEGYNAWNDFVRNVHGGIMPMAVYSKYYRVIDSSRPGKKDDPLKKTERHKRRGVEGVILPDSDIDMSGKMVYTLKTKTLPKKVMQASIAKGFFDVKCRHGMHLPSLAKLMMGIGDEKLCTASGKTYTPGKCSDPEFGMNDSECKISGAEWTPPSCVGMSDGVVKKSLGILETGASLVTDTTHKGAASLVNKKLTTTPSLNLHDSLYQAFGQKVGGGEGADNSDIFPSYFGVAYDDDTGVCKFNEGTCEGKPDYAGSKEICEGAGGTWKLSQEGFMEGRPLSWCERMGMDSYKTEKDDSFSGTDLVYQDCDTGLEQDVVALLFGQTVAKDIHRFEQMELAAGQDLLDGIETIGDFTTDTGSGGLIQSIEHPVDAVKRFVGSTLPNAWDKVTDLF